MMLKIRGAKISGISCVIPKKELLITDNKRLYDGNQKKIKRVIESSGFFKRRVVDSDVTTSDLCYKAALDLFSNIKCDKSKIDALLFISYTPDFLMPATSYVLHNRLGLSENCLCMDIPQACSGYEIGLFQAVSLIKSGYQKILLLVGDTFSKFSDMFKNNTAPVFGDAGTATLIKADDYADEWFFNINTDSSGYDSLICKNGGFRNPVKKELFYENGDFKYEAIMDGARVFDFTMQKIEPSIINLLSFSQIDKQKIDYFIMHQANKMILENIKTSLDIPEEKMPIGLMTEYGNQCGASVPCTISYFIHQKISEKRLQLFLSGFGVGLSWCNCIITVDKIYCSKLIEY